MTNGTLSIWPGRNLSPVLAQGGTIVLDPDREYLLDPNVQVTEPFQLIGHGATIVLDRDHELDPMTKPAAIALGVPRGSLIDGITMQCEGKVASALSLSGGNAVLRRIKVFNHTMKGIRLSGKGDSPDHIVVDDYYVESSTPSDKQQLCGLLLDSDEYQARSAYLSRIRIGPLGAKDGQVPVAMKLATIDRVYIDDVDFNGYRFVFGEGVGDVRISRYRNFDGQVRHYPDPEFGDERGRFASSYTFEDCLDEGSRP